MECNGHAIKIIKVDEPFDLEGMARITANFITEGDPVGYINRLKKKKEGEENGRQSN